jgi:hypothetical protein
MKDRGRLSRLAVLACCSVAIGIGGPTAALAQVPDEPEQPSADFATDPEIEALIERIGARINKIDQAAGGMDARLQFLDRQVETAINQLIKRGNENNALRAHAAGLSDDLL